MSHEAEEHPPSRRMGRGSPDPESCGAARAGVAALEGGPTMAEDVLRMKAELPRLDRSTERSGSGSRAFAFR